MYKVIIWGCGQTYNDYFNNIRLQELQGNLRVVALMSNETELSMVDQYRVVDKRHAVDLEYDYIIVAFKDLPSAFSEADHYGIDQSKLIPVKVFSIPYFDFNEYVKLKKSNISIISRNCCGGICYHFFGLPFLSPFINLFVEDVEFVKLVSNLKYYLNLPLKFVRMEYEYFLKFDYPVGSIGDICLYFNHYKSYEEAEACWYRRLKRINFDNLLIVSFTDSHKIAQEFDRLPFTNKVIFSPFKSDLKSSVFYKCSNSDVPYGIMINNLADGGGGVSPISLMSLLLHKDYKRIELKKTE